MNDYIVKSGESIHDVVLNSTGTLANLDMVLTANNFDNWTPILIPGQPIVIPDTVTIDANALRDAQAYPKCNRSVDSIFSLIDQVWDQLDDLWILSTGFWNDGSIWLDNKTWID